MTEKLLEARKKFFEGKKLEKMGEPKEARRLFLEALEIYRDVASNTSSNEQMGIVSRRGMILCTYHAEGIEKARKTLASMIKRGDISPKSILEVRTYLHIPFPNSSF